MLLRRNLTSVRAASITLFWAPNGLNELPEVRLEFPIILAPVVQTSDSAMHRINHYPADSVIDFRNIYPLDSDLSGG